MSADISDSDGVAQGYKQNSNIKARDLMAKGRYLNSSDGFNQEAFDQLSKAVKLDPHLTEAWIHLAKSYQKKSDIDGAITCLEKALEFCEYDHQRATILRKLSICTRQRQTTSQEEKVTALLKSLELSKQALKYSIDNRANYYNLAKAYMCLFFVTECVDQQLINLSRGAFIKALNLSNEDFSEASSIEAGYDSDEDSKPYMEQSDFLFNFSTVLIYLQEFDEALKHIKLAVRLDPNWNEPKKLEECLVDYLKQIHSIITELGKNSKKLEKRYCKVVKNLNDTQKIEFIIELDQKRLQKSSSITVKPITLSDLKVLETTKPKISENETSDDRTINLLHLKLVSTISYNQAMYLTFVAIDRDYSLIVVTIYNLASSKCPGIRDVVTLVDPRIERVTIENVAESKLCYDRINIREFKELYVNGLRITLDQVCKPQFKVSVLP